MNFNDYFTPITDKESATLELLNKLYCAGKFTEFNERLLNRHYCNSVGRQKSTGAVLKFLKDEISALYNKDRGMSEFIGHLTGVEAAADKAAPLSPEEKTYFNSPGKFKYFLHGQNSINEYLGQFSKVIQAYEEKKMLTVVFASGEPFCFTNAQALANHLIRVHELEMNIKTKTTDEKNTGRE